MKIVEKAEMHPNKCVVTGDIDGPFVDTGSWCDAVDPRIYLHVPFVEEMAVKLLDMVPRKDVEALQEQVEELRAKLENLEALEAAIGDLAEREAQWAENDKRLEEVKA